MRRRTYILAAAGAALLFAPGLASSQGLGGFLRAIKPPPFNTPIKKSATPAADGQSADQPQTAAAAAPAAPVRVGPPPPPPAVPRPGPGWINPDPENTWVIETSKGVIVAELEPALAPATVERIKRLTRAGFYDNRKFFRVIDEFMAQTGDPENNGEGGSALPDIPGEFSMRRKSNTIFTVVPSKAGFTGFIGSVPVLTQPDAQMAITADGAVPTHGMFCPGVLGMARGNEPNSANSQCFLMRQYYPSLDGSYAAFGRVLTGLDVVRAIKTGEPPSEPMDLMVRARMMADIPEAERPKVQVMDTRSAEFYAYSLAWSASQGDKADICKLDIPAVVQ